MGNGGWIEIGMELGLGMGIEVGTLMRIGGMRMGMKMVIRMRMGTGMATAMKMGASTHTPVMFSFCFFLFMLLRRR